MAPSPNEVVACVRAELEKDWYALRQLRVSTHQRLGMVDAATLFLRTEHRDSAEIQRRCEELALLAALRQLDFTEWKKQVFELWEALEGEGIEADRPFEFGLEFPVDRTSLLLELATAPPSASSAREVASKRAVELHGCSFEDVANQVPIRLVLDYAFIKWPEEEPRDVRLVKELQGILHLATTMKNATTAGAPCFRIQEVSIDRHYDLVANQDALEIMTKLVTCGVRVWDLPAISSRDRSSLLKTLQLLVLSSLSPPVYSGIETLVVSDASAKEAIPAVMSALAFSTTLQRVDLHYNGHCTGQAREDFWRWIAYALFSREAVTSARHLRFLPRKIGREEVELMRPVLEADEPLSVLLGGDCDGLSARVWLSATRFIFTAPSPGEDDDALVDFISSQRLVVPTIKKVDGGWSVFLPGYGKAWVRDQDGEVVAKPNRLSTSRNRKWTVSSTLGPQDLFQGVDSLDATIALLELIGTHVVRIELEKHELTNLSIPAERPTWLHEILSACPNVRELEIGNLEICCLDVFVDCPAAHRLRKLVINGSIHVFEDLNNASGFFETLKDPSHPLAKSLQHLDVTFLFTQDTPYEIIEMVESTWTNSTSLQTMDIGMWHEDCATEFNMDIEEAFEELQSEAEKQSVALPLAAEAKTSFLSVLSVVVRDETLDSGILSTIFDFAGSMEKRHFRGRIL